MPQNTDTIDKINGVKTRNHASLSDDSEIVSRILRALSGLEYGSVEIIVQDSKVVQIERTQRSRFAKPLDIPRP